MFSRAMKFVLSRYLTPTPRKKNLPTLFRQQWGSQVKDEMTLFACWVVLRIR